MTDLKLARKKFNTNDAKLYNTSKWRNFRIEWLKTNYNCINCESTHKLCLDHIFEFHDSDFLFWDKKNIQTLCWSCHFQKTTRDKNFLKFSPLKQNEILTFCEQNFNIEKEQNNIEMLRDFYKKRYQEMVRQFSKSDEKRFDILNLKVVEFKELINMLQNQLKINLDEINIVVENYLKKSVLI